MKTKITLLLAGLCLGACAQLIQKQEQKGILGEGAKFEVVSTAGIGFGEGVVAAKDGKIYTLGVTWADEPIKNGVIYRYDPVTGETSEYMKPSGSALGLHVDKNNDLLIAASDPRGGPQGIMRHNFKTRTTTVITDNYKGKRYVAPNDLTTDAKGRIYFTDARYEGKTLPWELPNAVYRIDLDGTVTQIATDIFRPNGIEVSPDSKRLYVAAANAKRLIANPLGPLTDKFGIENGGVVAYDLDDNGNVSKGRAIFQHEKYNVDGMAMDTGGNLYLAVHNGRRPPVPGEIIVLDPDGKVLEKLIPPEGTRPSNLAFGRGDDANSLYITTGLGMPWKLLRIKTTRRGFYRE
jgi:gluconolactonase